MKKGQNYSDLIKKVEEITKKKKVDLSSDEDLSIAVMNLISIEEHLFFTSQKTEKPQYLEILNEVRLLRTDLMKRLIKDYEGEVWCLPPQTVIFANPAPRNISDFVKGEKVLSHKGDFSEIKEVFKRKYVGHLIDIKPYYGDTLSITPGHEILCATGVRSKQKELWRKEFKTPNIVWKKAGDLNSADFLLFPRYQEIENLEQVDLEYSWTNKGCFKPTTFKQKRKISVSKELLKLIGLYLAEGSISEGSYMYKGHPKTRGNIYFSLGKHETNLIMETSRLFKKIFEEDLRVSETRTTIDLLCTKRIIIKFFKQFGQRSREKEIPLWVLRLPQKKLLHLIWGLVKGDGFVDKYHISYFTSSEKLAYQIRLLLFKTGVLHSLKKTETNGGEIEGRKIGQSHGYTISISGDAARILNNEVGLKYKVKRTSGNLGYLLKDYVMIPIRKIEKKPYSGFVYNLHTEANTYTTFTGVVHNCTSKHLLAASMRVMEVGTKELKKDNRKEAWKLFEKAFKLYSLFWAINLKVVKLDDVPMDDGNINFVEEKEIKSKDSVSPLEKFSQIFKKAIDCCRE